MKRLLAGRGAPAAAVTVLVALAAGGGYALASGTGTIHACVHKGSRTLYRAPCHRGDKKLSWNQTGPPGAPGAKGNTGSPGSPGAPGALSVSTAWTYPSAATPQSDGQVAKFTFTAPAAGYEVVTAHFGVRVHNTTGVDCHVESQLAPAPAVLGTVSPGAANQPGFIDSWINGNLPTENSGGTYLELEQSVTRVFAVTAGSNSVYLNGSYAATGTTPCAAALWGPIEMTGLFAQQNDSTATVTAP